MLLFAHRAPLHAQTTTDPATSTTLRSDDEDFRILLKPAEVITWGIGLFAKGKVSANLGNLSLGSGSTSNPSFSFSAYNSTTGDTDPGALDIRPGYDFGITLYAPMLTTILGRNIGVNLDIALVTYRFGVQYTLTNILEGDAKALGTAKGRYFAQSGVGASAQNNGNIFPKFYSSYHYLNFAPMLNISNFLLGANIGIPMPGMPSQMITPANTILKFPSAVEVVPAAQLRTIIEPRIGFMSPLITTRIGQFNFLATLSWMPRISSPLDSSNAATIRKSSTLLASALDSWWASERLMNTSLPVSPYAKAIDNSFLLDPLSISVGISYIFNFSNAAIIDQFERESFTNDSIRAVYASVSRVRDSLRERSVVLADSLANTVIAQSRLRDTLVQVQKAFELDVLKRRQDSIRKAQEREIFAAKEELAVTVSQKKGLEVQKRDLETKNKQKDKALALQAREISDKQKALEEKQRLIEEARKKVFEAKLGSIVGMNDDGSEMVENPTLRVEEFRATNSKVLVPTVFFDQNSSLIPARYKQIQSSNREAYKIPDDPRKTSFALHTELLNIIAKRLLEAPPTVILTLTGVQNADESDAKLAAKRAETVAGYLINTWKIPTTRIVREAKRQAGNAPDGRTVQISASEPGIIAPYTLPDIARTATPPIITIGLNITSGAGIKQWQLGIRQIVDNEDVEIKDTTAKTVIPRYSWFVNDEQSSLPRSGNALTVSLEATDISNAKAPEAPVKEIKVEKITVEQKKASGKADNTVYFYELLYGATLTDLSTQSNALLNEIKSHITPEARVRITAYNPRPADVAVSEIAQILGVDAAKATLRTVAAKRNTAPTPEAAIYNNSILIRIETPSKP